MLTFHNFSLQAQLVLLTFLLNKKLPFSWKRFSSTVVSKEIQLWSSKGDVFLHKTRNIVIGWRQKCLCKKNDWFNISSRQAAQSHATLMIPDYAHSINCAVSNTNAPWYLFLLLRSYKPPAIPFSIDSTLKTAPRVCAQKSVIAYWSRDRKHSCGNWNTATQLYWLQTTCLAWWGVILKRTWFTPGGLSKVTSNI